jgi:hypothetical protein
MDLAAAARQIVDETSHKAQLGNLDPEAQAEAVSVTAAALADATGKSAAAVTAIARCLYWKLNPLGTVPPSFYDDANFSLLADRIREIVGTQEPSGTPTAESRTPVWPEPSAVEDLFKDIDDEPSPDEIEPDDVATIDAIGSKATLTVGKVQAPTMQEFLALRAHPEVVTPENSGLEAIQKVLVDFVADLSEAFTIKPKWQGREAEAIAAPARAAAKKILDIQSQSPTEKPSDEDVSEIVPRSWAAHVAKALFDRLEGDVIVMWSTDGSRQTAIHAVAAKIGARIGRIALIDECIVRNGFDEPVTIDNPREWAHEVASDVYRLLLADDFRPYSSAIGAATREKSIADLGKEIFENIVPAVVFREMGVPQRPVVVTEDAPSIPPAGVQREPWKMPWSVARRVVDELCEHSNDPDALLSSFSDFFGLKKFDFDGIRNELVSEIVVIGREHPVVDESTVTSGPAIRFVYQNYAGKIAVRNAVPVRMTFGSNEWHKQRQWLMEAFDLDQGAMRTFAVKDIIKFIDGEAA